MDDAEDLPPSSYSADQPGLSWWGRYAAPAQERLLDRPQEQRNAYGRAALGLVPGPGNIISAQDAAESWDSAKEKFDAGKPAAGDAAMAALSGIGAVPVMGTLAKAGGSAYHEAMGIARAMRGKGAANAEIHAATGLAFTPAGELVREIPDTAAKLNLEGRAAGSGTTLGEVLHHPELYAHRPELSNMPVRLVEKPWADKPSSAVTDMGNTLGVSVSDLSGEAQDFIRAQILKRVQQSEPGLSIAGRHSVGSNISDLERTSAGLDELLKKYVHDSDLKKYAGLIGEYKTKLAEMVSAGKTPGRMENHLYERMTGGDLADLVRARSLSPDAPSMPFALHKYTTEAPSIVRMFRPDRLPLPPKGVEGEDLAEFARNWSKYGGRP